jgi:hypothetical protein
MPEVPNRQPGAGPTGLSQQEHKHVRWTPKRKAEVIDDMLTGKLTMAEACQQHDLSNEEIESWFRTHKTYGTYGLRVTRLHCYYPERRRS